jgi:hypothetical protein
LAQKAQARAGGHAFGPLGPAARGDGGGMALRRGPARQREGGRANFACGGLWRPVHGTVAGARDGDAAGEGSGHNSVGEVACRDHESVAELLA